MVDMRRYLGEPGGFGALADLSLTNVGILDAARISFGDVRPRDAVMCGSIKYKPHFQLAMSSYAGSLTLSSDVYSNASDRKRVLSFLVEVERELLTERSGRE
jgi:NRPS condensation-like uncharacterized protein